jgi:transcriptional regulator with XRE-family HTH domain
MAIAWRTRTGYNSRMQFKKFLRDAREKAGLTPEELGERAGVHPQTIRKLEDGQRTWPRLDIACKLANALGVPLTDFCPKKK